MRFYGHLILFLITLALFVWLAWAAHHHIVTAALFFYFGYAHRPDIDVFWRRLNQKLDEWADV